MVLVICRANISRSRASRRYRLTIKNNWGFFRCKDVECGRDLPYRPERAALAGLACFVLLTLIDRSSDDHVCFASRFACRLKSCRLAIIHDTYRLVIRREILPTNKQLSRFQNLPSANLFVLFETQSEHFVRR